MLVNTICYKTKKDLVINEGTQYEVRHNTFLECYLYGATDEQARAKVDELNAGLNPSSNIEYYFINKQEEMF